MTEKQAQRIQLQADMLAFTQRGGVVDEVPYGYTAWHVRCREGYDGRPTYVREQHTIDEWYESVTTVL